MWDGIWKIVLAILFRIVIKISADAGEQALIAVARRIVQAQVNALPISQRASFGEGIIADFETRATTLAKLTFAIQMVPAYMKLLGMDCKKRLSRTLAHFRWVVGSLPSLVGHYVRLPICIVRGHHTWKHASNPALYYCRACGTQAPRWRGFYNGHGGYHCDLNVKPTWRRTQKSLSPPPLAPRSPMSAPLP